MLIRHVTKEINIKKREEEQLIFGILDFCAAAVLIIDLS